MNNKIKIITQKTLYNYFKLLSNTGYVNNDSIFKVLSVVFLEEILSGEIIPILTEEDYTIIDTFLYNILGTSCLIPYPDYYKKMSINKVEDTSLFRLTESELFRLLELNKFKIN